MNSKDLTSLCKKPHLLAQFQATGKLPTKVIVSSPLLSLLQSLYPRERAAIRNLRIGSELGYTGRRTFQNAEQALRWLLPQDPYSMPASESWRDKRFKGRLLIEDLSACASVPAEVAAKWASRNKHLYK